MEWRNDSITKEKYREILLEKVVPAIIEKWPRDTWCARNFILRIQQDGPNSHISADDKKFEEGLRRLNVENKILIYTQPPNSPDLNINDLGFFRAIDAAYRQYNPSTEEDIVRYVLRAYEE